MEKFGTGRYRTLKEFWLDLTAKDMDLPKNTLGIGFPRTLSCLRCRGFAKIRGTLCGVLIIRILLFRVLH